MKDDVCLNNADVFGKGLLFGFGRMGLTHMSLINKYAQQPLEWFVVDPSIAVSLLVRLFGRLIGVEMISPSDIKLHRFDIGLICSPPRFHLENYDLAEGTCNKIFVEKPAFLGAIQSNKTYVGYSLRHHPCISYLERIADGKGFKSVTIEVKANTVLSEGNGWRASSSQGGVVNEFGSHAVNLARYLLGVPFTLSKIETERVVSLNCPDKCLIVGHTLEDSCVQIKLNWSDPVVRKPIFLVTLEMMSGEVWYTDVSEVWQLDSNGNRVNISGVASWESNADFYVRGLEFSEQARYFLENVDFSEDLRNSEFTDQFLEKCR